MAFGAEPHMCLGLNLARLEMRTLLRDSCSLDAVFIFMKRPLALWARTSSKSSLAVLRSPAALTEVPTFVLVACLAL